MSGKLSDRGAAAAPEQASGIALASLLTGLAGVVLVLVFFVTMAGPVVAYLGLAVGVVGVLLGIVALRKKQSRGMAVTGIIAGALSALVVIALFTFALVFLGVFGG